MKRLLAIATAFVVPANRAVFASLADDFGYDVTLISPCNWSTRRYGANQTFKVAAEERSGYRVVPLRHTAGRFDRYHALMPVVRRVRPHIALCAQEFDSFAAIQSLFLARLMTARPMTVSCSTQNMPYSPAKLRHHLRDCAALAMSDVILASCTDAAAMLVRRGYKGRVAVTFPFGAASISRPFPAAVRHRNAPFTVGFVGRIAAEKGVFTLAEACARMHGDIRLLFVGDGPDRTRLETRLQELQLSDRALFVGAVDRDKVADYYAQMDVFVLPTITTPSCKEQFGVVLAEAMLMGVPVVGSSCGAIPEVVGEAGLIFAEGDPGALHACLQTLHDEPERSRVLAARAIARAQAHYTPRALARALDRVFTEAVTS